jgi:hypothetical protein
MLLTSLPHYDYPELPFWEYPLETIAPNPNCPCRDCINASAELIGTQDQAQLCPDGTPAIVAYRGMIRL